MLLRLGRFPHRKHNGCIYTELTYHIITFIFIPWIRTGLQNPYGYGNRQICLKKSRSEVYNNFSY